LKTFVLDCGNCSRRLMFPLTGPSSRKFCPNCGSEIHMDVFPALLKGPAKGKSALELMDEQESSCFYHPNKKAVIPCEGCGRFLCDLCDVDFGGNHLCPVCIERGVRPGAETTAQGEEGNKAVRHDSIALLMAIAPLLIFYLTLISAPITIYYSIRQWNSHYTVTGRGKWRFVAAILIASLEIIGWAALFTGLIVGW